MSASDICQKHICLIAAALLSDFMFTGNKRADLRQQVTVIHSSFVNGASHVCMCRMTMS